MIYLKLTTPTNIGEEREKFFAQPNYSPQLKYNWSPEDIAAYESKEPRLSGLIDALVRQDTQAIEQEAASYFDIAFRHKDVKMAETYTAKPPAAGKPANADDYAKVLSQKIDELGLGYSVEIVDRHGFQCRPDHKAKTMRISKYLHLQFHTAEGVANHEIIHAIRAVNGRYNGIKPQPGYLPTEEGLAALVQDSFFTTLTGSGFQHALEYRAAQLSKSAGFKEVYQFLRDHGCDAETAWLRGIRQKFGLCDTSRPGGLMKAAMYFYHEQLLLELPHESLVRLFVGKIPLSQLESYPQYTGTSPREKLEAFLAAA